MLKPYYEQDGITIYHADFREIVPSFRFRFDVLLTDPPYGHGDKWSGGTWASDPMYADAKRWDEKLPDVEILALIERAHRAIIWGGNYYALPPSRSWLAWVKTSRMDTLADFELAWTNLERPSKLIEEDRNPDGKRWHPTQKPESVILWALARVAAARTVLDPFMGSGTTLVAAKRLGKAAIGIDREEKYCEIAAKRLAQGALSFEAPCA